MSRVLHLNKKLRKLEDSIEGIFIPISLYFIRIILLKDHFIYNRRKVDKRITKNYIQKRKDSINIGMELLVVKPLAQDQSNKEPTKVVSN